MGPEFAVSVQRLGRRLLVAPRGELDLATAPELTERMLETLAGTDHQLTEVAMSLAHVDFVDLAGIRAISRCEELAQAHGAQFVVTDPQPQARRLFELCAMWRYMVQT